VVCQELSLVARGESAGRVSVCALLEREITFEGRNKEIISDTLEVGNAPPDLLPSPFAPMGESIAIGVEDIIALFHGRVKVGLFGEIDVWEERDRDCTPLARTLKITCTENHKREHCTKTTWAQARMCS
jgi:hypothetical protein